MWEYLRTEYVEIEDPYAEYYLVDFERLIDRTATFMLYVTIALIVGLLIAWAIVYHKNNRQTPSVFKNIAVGIAIGYSLCVIFLIGYLNIVYSIIDEKITTNFWIILGLFGFLLVATIVSVVLKAKNSKFFKPFLIVVGVLALAALIVMLVLIPAKKAKYEPLSLYGMYIISAILVAVIAALTFIFDRTKQNEGAKSLAYASVCIALSYALSFVKFFTLGPNGGSITFASLLPLMIFAYKFGPKKGVVAGMIYGLLQFIQSPQFYQPMQVLLDYPIAFGAIGLTGLFKNSKLLKNEFVKFFLGALLAVFLRYAAHVISGYYVFSSWAWEGYGPLAYSMVYNLFCFVDLAIVLVPAAAIFGNKTLSKKLFY